MTGAKITTKKVDKRQAGAAAILITMVTMIVVSLIVIGFAMIARREQGNTLDQQLSTQAFYAAESGVNDARSVIMAAVNDHQPVPGKRNCTTYDNGDTNYNPTYSYPVPPPGKNGVPLDSAHNVSYTCLLVNPNVTTLVYDDVGDQSKVVPIAASGTVNKITISWSPTISGGNSSSCPGSTNQTFRPAPNWNCGYGVLRMDAVPTDGTLIGGTGPSSLESKTLTVFFEPQKNPGGGSLPYNKKGKANVVAAKCDQGNLTLSSQCTATITGLASAGSKTFSLRINSLYQLSNVKITVYGQGGKTLPVSGAQVVVDATGNANGVLRRILVHIPATVSSNLIPDDAIETNDALCKQFVVAPNYLSIPGAKDADPKNAMCQPQ